MARYTDAVCKLCRRERQKLFLKGSKCYTEKCPVERRNYPPGQHGANVRRSKVEPMKEVASMILNHFEGVVAWVTSRQTNGFMEAINSLFQAAKRKARGYVRFRTIRTVIFLIAGKLDFSKLNPFVAQPT